MPNKSNMNGDTVDNGAGELRAFVSARIGGYSWVVDLVPNLQLTLGSAEDADIRIEVDEVAPQHATVAWDGATIRVTPADGHQLNLNGEPIVGSQEVNPGDEMKAGPAVLVVNVTLAPSRSGRRSLTHREFCERVSEELARSARTGRHTCLVMLKSKSGDGSGVAAAALSSFRDGDIIGTYAHDEIEFLLPDTPPNVASAVIERLIESAAAQGGHAGLAVAPDDGDSAERLLRAARDAMATAMSHDVTVARSGPTVSGAAITPNVHSEATRAVVEDITRAAADGDNVLVHGEPSSGKRFYARLFHERSQQADGPFVVINCPGLVDAAATTRAFGAETGSPDDCLAETAKGGTLVLDELGDLPLQGQRRLLRLFEEGSEDYAIVGTTFRDLDALCGVGAFLRPLYEKVATRRVGVPALRMRAESIVPLAKDFAKQFGQDKPVKLSAGAIDKMRTYNWPGNVLELRNAMERAVTLADGGEILAEHLPGDAADAGEGRLRDHVGSVERDAIIKALADNNYNQTHAAKLLGISRRALIYKMEKYGLKQPPAGAKKT